MGVGLAVAQWREFGARGSDQSGFSAVPSPRFVLVCECGDFGHAVGVVLQNVWVFLVGIAQAKALGGAIDFGGPYLAALGVCVYELGFAGVVPLLVGVCICLAGF